MARPARQPCRSVRSLTSGLQPSLDRLVICFRSPSTRRKEFFQKLSHKSVLGRARLQPCRKEPTKVSEVWLVNSGRKSCYEQSLSFREPLRTNSPCIRGAPHRACRYCCGFFYSAFWKMDPVVRRSHNIAQRSYVRVGGNFQSRSYREGWKVCDALPCPGSQGHFVARLCHQRRRYSFHSPARTGHVFRGGV